MQQMQLVREKKTVYLVQYLQEEDREEAKDIYILFLSKIRYFLLYSNEARRV